MAAAVGGSTVNRRAGFRGHALIAAAVVLSAALTGCATATAASPDAIAERADAVGIAPELVYTTDVDGYDLAPQSVGPTGGIGISATWFNNSTGAMLTIRTEPGELTAASCASTPLWEGPDEPVTCAEEQGVWHRVGGDVHEYVAQRGDAQIWVTGSSNAPPEHLLQAANAARVPSDAELERLFSDLPATPAGPVERGDLPENGDGAPIDPSGPGG